MHAKDNLDEWLYGRLLTVEDEMVDASGSDLKAMKSFLDRLKEIQRLAAQALAENSLTAKTITLLRNVASSGSALVRLTSGVQRARADVERRRQAQLENAMMKLSLEDNTEDDCSGSTKTLHDTPGRQPAPSECAAPVVLNTETSPLAPHVSRCYEWLLQNLHNPYPHHTFRTKVSKDTGVSERAISDWFTNIRRKIGWNEIRKKKFKNDRILTVNCARAVLLEEKSKVPVSEELREVFLRMKDTANGLFRDVLIPSDTAKHLDDLVAGHVSKLAQGKNRNNSGSELGPCVQAPCQREVLGQVTSSRARGKRRADSVIYDDVSSSSRAKPDTRPTKRLRGTPGPLDTSQQLLGNKQSSNSVPQSTSLTSPPPRPRKRRLSDEDECPWSKRLRSSSDGNTLSQDSADIDAVSIAGPPLFPAGTPEEANDVVLATSSSPLIANPHASDQQASSPSRQEADDTLHISADSPWLSQIFIFQDFIDLPDVPTLTCDGSDILPPSIEPLPPTSDLSISYPDLDSQWGFDIPVLANSDSCSPSSFDSDFPPELKLDEPLLDLAGIQLPESSSVSPSIFFDELLRIDDKLRSEQPAETSRSGEPLVNFLQSIA